MSEKAKQMGIPESHLLRALTLARDLRRQAIKEGLDRRATRIALIFAERTDYYFARQCMFGRDLKKLEEIAAELFQQTKNSG